MKHVITVIELKIVRDYRIKAFGDIVCFRDLEKATKDAIKTFGDESSMNIILEKGYGEYMEGSAGEETGRVIREYKDIYDEIVEKFPDSTEIFLEVGKKEFVQLFGKLLKSENILKNFDEFESFDKVTPDRSMQDMENAYVDIRENIVNSRRPGDSEEQQVDLSDIELRADLLKTDEISLDYILVLILGRPKEHEGVENSKTGVRKVARPSLGTRTKEDLVIDSINKTRLSESEDNDGILETFYSFTKKEKEEKVEFLIEDEKLKEGAYHFINKSIKKGFVDYAGTGLNKILPPAPRRQGTREKKEQIVLEKIEKVIEVFAGV